MSCGNSLLVSEALLLSTSGGTSHEYMYLQRVHLQRNKQYYLSLVVRKPVFGVSDQVRHKPGCTITEAGYRLQISDIGSRGDSENKGADQLRSYCAADLCLCFRICKKPVFSQRGSFDSYNYLKYPPQLGISN